MRPIFLTLFILSVTLNVKAKRYPLRLVMETEIHTQRDDNLDLVGEESIFTFKPNYDLTKNLRLGFGVTYIERAVGGTEKFKESKNRDHLQEVYTRLRFNHLKESKGDLLDLRWQFRYYQDQDPYFKEKRGSDSNYQLRIYLGKRIYQGFFISRHTSYLRYKKYQHNKYAKGKSRDYELRARVSPTYRFKNQIDLGLSVTYNHLFQLNNTDDENIDLDLGVRKQFDKITALFRINYPWMVKSKYGDLIENELARNEIQYAFNIEMQLL